jgi:hypothetical protein
MGILVLVHQAKDSRILSNSSTIIQFEFFPVSMEGSRFRVCEFHTHVWYNQVPVISYKIKSDYGSKSNINSGLYTPTTQLHTTPRKNTTIILEKTLENPEANSVTPYYPCPKDSKIYTENGMGM